MIVETVRTIIDAVNPTRSYYTLEMIGNRFPNSVDSCLDLIKAIDRKRYAAHLDPVNIINSPHQFYSNGDLIRECFAKLGTHIKSCHAKDIRELDRLPIDFQECRPGLGKLDYAVYLNEASRLPEPPPLMLEHLEQTEEYRAAADYIRSVAKDQDLSFA